MAIRTLHKLDVIALPGPVYLDNLTNQRHVAGIQSMLENPAGHVYPMFRANQNQQPLVEATTCDLAKVLGVIPVQGAALGAVSTYFKRATTVNNVARATTSHRKITIASSLGYWSNLHLPHNGRGEVSIILQAAYDGANDPFVYAGTQALPSNLTGGSRWGAGPVSINGTAIPGVQDISIDSGITLLQLGGESEEFDTFVGIQTGMPSVTIKTLELVNWSLLGLRGAKLNGSTGLVCYGRKFSESVTGGLSRVANNTAEHLKFVGLNGTAIPVDTSGDGNSPMSDTLKVELIAGTDSIIPLTHSVAAIT